MNIGQAARASGVSAKLIRYYEQIGLIQSTERTGGNYRSFGPREVSELRFIRRARTVGYSVDEIRTLLSLWRDPALSSGEIRARADGHLTELEGRIVEMQRMADALRALSEETQDGARPEFPGAADPEPPGPTPRRRRPPK